MSKVQVIDKKQLKKDEAPKEENTTIPEGYFEVQGLPSRGLLYPKGTKVYSRPLRILEVKTLSTINEHNYNDVVNSVLEKTVKGIKVDDMIIADKVYTIFWQRANTYKGDGFSINFECPECKTSSKYDFDISAVQLEKLREDYDPNEILVLPDTKTKITFRHITVKDEKAISDFLNSDKNKDFDEEMIGLCVIVHTINGKELSLADKYKVLTEEITTKDNIVLIQEFAKNEISVQPFMNVTCKNCGGVVETPLNFRPDFFLPEYKVS